MSVITTRSLTKRYGSRTGIEDVQLDLPRGVVFGFLGPNGAGKTTTIRLLLGFLRPTSGTARVFGYDCWHQSRRIKEDLGYLPGDLRLYPWLTGRVALRIVSRARRRDLTASGHDLADDLGLDMNVRVSSMSRGMRQKLGLILALAHSPRLLVLDEPTSALDPVIQERLKSRLKELAAKGHTIFFSSHTLSEVERLCDRLAVVRDGRVVADATLDELRREASREVLVRWRSSETALGTAVPCFLELLDRDDSQWRCTLRGPVKPLLGWLRERDAAAIDDITIAPPDLEALFQRYYRI